MPLPYRIILYYQFFPVSSPEAWVDEQKELCRSLSLLGRVYISEEGINGTLSGTPAHIEKYKKALREVDGLGDVEFKEDACDRIPFSRLSVKYRPEIVSLRVQDRLDPVTDGGKRLSPKEWRRTIECEDDYVMIDVRNNYESQIGHFKDALRPDVENFYDFPQWLDEAGISRDKKILMYCTGGIRCEKFSVLMKKKGYHDVNQLHGGILKYAREEGGRHFRGKCFVFDDRLVVPVNPEYEDPISRCEITGDPCDMYLNCANMECNRLFICSEKGAGLMEGCCSETCRKNPRKRPFDPAKAYAPFRRWYHYFGEGFKKKSR